MSHEETPTPESGAATPPAAEVDPTDVDSASAPSSEFARALQDFEGGKPPGTRGVPEAAPGAKVRGKLVSIAADHGVVDFGGRSEGVVEIRHLQDESGTVTKEVGDVLDLFVVSTGDQVVLAPSVRADSKSALQQMRESQQNGVPVEGRVTGRNAGGLEVEISGVRGFCPVSQVEAGFCADPSIYVGRTLEFLVTEVKEGKGGVVLSRRTLLRREEQEKGRHRVASLKAGDELDGTVVRLEPFGAFVNLGGVDGLVHVSEIRHERTGHPSEALKVGEPVRVRVLKIEPGKKGKPRIALSIKATAPDPWGDVERRFPKGSRVQGTVVRLADFGAFVNLAPGIDGLVHVSEASSQPVAHVRDALEPGQTVEAVVLAADPVKRRVSLSIRATEPGYEPQESGRRGDRGGDAGRPRGERRGEGRDARERSVEKPAPPQPAADAPLTTMALALRKAMEKSKQKKDRDSD